MSSVRYPAHPSYKNTGIASCPMRPEHWSITRLKFMSELNPSKSQVGHLDPLTTVTFLPMEAIGENGELDVSQERALQDVRNGYTFLGEGDVCIAKITPCFENGKGAIITGTSNGIAFATTEVIPFRCKRSADAGFLYYLLTAAPFKLDAEASMYGAGGQKRVADSFVGNYSAVLPPPAERSQIAAFLDYETAKIDALIEKQQQLIALLKEKRQAVISHAVTKGLNPDVPMRDSGVEWLGEVPTHWIVCKIKQVAKLESGHTPSKKVDEYWQDCQIPWVSLNDTSQLKVVDYISETAVCINDKGMASSSAHELPAGCVVFTRDASIGLAAITARVMAVSQHIIAWVCDPMKVTNKYLLLVFYAMEAELERFTFGATLKTIGMPDVKRLMGAFPPLEEQAQIVEQVFSEREALSASIRKSEEMLEILAERRTALISAAITGKIDVRGWKAPESAVEEEVA